MREEINNLQMQVLKDLDGTKKNLSIKEIENFVKLLKKKFKSRKWV